MFTNFLKRLRKKRHFKRKLDLLERKLWDLEFVRKKHRNIREGFRIEYDRMREMVDAAETKVKMEKEKEDPDKTILESLNNLMERFKPDIEQLQSQMMTADQQIEGEGGINQAIDDHHSAQSLLKEYLKEL